MSAAPVQKALKRAHAQYVEGEPSSQTERYRALERTVRPEVQWPGKEVGATQAKSSRVRPEHWLLVVSAWEYLSLQISAQASNQVWLDFYAGDYGAQARAMGRLAAAGGLLGFLLKPMLAQASDVFGRKPLLLISYVIQAVVKSGIALAPPSVSVPLLAVSQYLLGFVTWELSTQTIDSAIGEWTPPAALGCSWPGDGLTFCVA
jgi:MFS family permease